MTFTVRKCNEIVVEILRNDKQVAFFYKDCRGKFGKHFQRLGSTVPGVSRLSEVSPYDGTLQFHYSDLKLCVAIFHFDLLGRKGQYFMMTP